MRDGRPIRLRPSGHEWSTAFDRIRLDRTHGAHALSTEALAILSRLTSEWSDSPDTVLRTRFRQVARSLERAQPAMGPFLRWATQWRAMARPDSPVGLTNFARGWLRRERRLLRNELPRVTRTSRRRFPKVRLVVTFSRSRSVLAALKSPPRSRRPERILVLESLPGGEGRLFARDLRNAGLRARGVPDVQGGRVVKTAGLVLLGADAIYRDGTVVHKVGTHRLARAAASAGVPVVVVAGRSKFTGRRSPRRALPDLFDRTPRRYVSEFWTDQGVRRGGSGNPVVSQRSPL
ncbi:MAG: hypothetical protein WB788_07795 [Thermoplasmata archaeon]